MTAISLHRFVSLRWLIPYELNDFRYAILRLSHGVEHCRS